MASQYLRVPRPVVVGKNRHPWNYKHQSFPALGVALVKLPSQVHLDQQGVNQSIFAMPVDTHLKE
jgi:hypothetical protein